MHVLFIRHGEPDYSFVMERGFIGHGQDLAQLTETGRAQALAVAEDSRLDGIEMLLSSPYTRALQTAAIISRRRDIELIVETDLHEWIPDFSYANDSEQQKDDAFKLFMHNKGTCPADSPVRYEEIQAVFDRGKACLSKYLSYNKIAVVTHGLLISTFCHPIETPWGGLTEFEFTDDAMWRGWVE